MVILDHLTCLLRNLYAGQEATVSTRHGTTNCSKLGKEYVKSGYCHPAYLSKWWYLDLNTGLYDFRGLLFPTCKAGMWAQLTAFLHLLFTCKENRSDHEVQSTHWDLRPGNAASAWEGRVPRDSVVRDPLEPIHWPLCVCVLFFNLILYLIVV